VTAKSTQSTWRALRSRARRAASIACAILTVLLVGFQSTAAAQTSWKVSGRQGVVYLVGSVHLLTKDYYPLNPSLDTAFQDSNLLVEELDLSEMLDPMAQLKLLSRGMLPAGRSLEDVVSPATLALVSKTVGDLGLPFEPLKRFKPWMLALTLLGLQWQQAGFDPQLGLDRHFYDRAKAEGRAIEGLETLDYQIRRFDDIPMSEQDHLLAETLKTLATEIGSVKTLADAWRAGDIATLERIVLKDLKAEPKMYQRLLVERNRNWLPKIEALFERPGGAFVVVGAAHLVGPDGLPALLKAKGYVVDQQ
jgi:uncharacterized protein YbaP (TraB family)